MAEIIKDLKSGTLKLYKTKLVELTGEAVRGVRWTLDLHQINPKFDASDLAYGQAVSIVSGSMTGSCRVKPDEYAVGCRPFSKTVFRQIIKAARALRKKEKVGRTK